MLISRNFYKNYPDNKMINFPLSLRCLLANSGVTSAYIVVVSIDSCPGKALITTRDSPHSSICTAMECRTLSELSDNDCHSKAMHLLQAGVNLFYISNPNFYKILTFKDNTLKIKHIICV